MQASIEVQERIRARHQDYDSVFITLGQLYVSLPSSNGWTRAVEGYVQLAKKVNADTAFINIYRFTDFTLAFQHELYRGFFKRGYCKDAEPSIVTFQSDICVFAIGFLNHETSVQFSRHVKTLSPDCQGFFAKYLRDGEKKDKRPKEAKHDQLSPPAPPPAPPPPPVAPPPRVRHIVLNGVHYKEPIRTRLPPGMRAIPSNKPKKLKPPPDPGPMFQRSLRSLDCDHDEGEEAPAAAKNGRRPGELPEPEIPRRPSRPKGWVKPEPPPPPPPSPPPPRYFHASTPVPMRRRRPALSLVVMRPSKSWVIREHTTFSLLQCFD
jgi:hypothetical protein